MSRMVNPVESGLPAVQITSQNLNAEADRQQAERERSSRERLTREQIEAQERAGQLDADTRLQQQGMVNESFQTQQANELDFRREQSELERLDNDRDREDRLRQVYYQRELDALDAERGSLLLEIQTGDNVRAAEAMRRLVEVDEEMTVLNNENAEHQMQQNQALGQKSQNLDAMVGFIAAQAAASQKYVGTANDAISSGVETLNRNLTDDPAFFDSLFRGLTRIPTTGDIGILGGLGILGQNALGGITRVLMGEGAAVPSTVRGKDGMLDVDMKVLEGAEFRAVLPEFTGKVLGQLGEEVGNSLFAGNDAAIAAMKRVMKLAGEITVKGEFADKDRVLDFRIAVGNLKHEGGLDDRQVYSIMTQLGARLGAADGRRISDGMEGPTKELYQRMESAFKEFGDNYHRLATVAGLEAKPITKQAVEEVETFFKQGLQAQFQEMIDKGTVGNFDPDVWMEDTKQKLELAGVPRDLIDASIGHLSEAAKYGTEAVARQRSMEENQREMTGLRDMKSRLGTEQSIVQGGLERDPQQLAELKRLNDAAARAARGR